MPIKLFIFDFDGTLADSGPWAATAVNKAAARFGFRSLSAEDIDDLRGRDSRTILRELRISWWRIPQIAAYVRKLAKAEEPPPLFPGIEPLLRGLHGAGFRLAIVSSNTEAAVRRTLGDDLASLFEVFACNASLFGKASKFKRVLRLTRIAAADAVSIGDESRDIEAARSAGVACGAVAWGYAKPALLKSLSPDHFFETPGAIGELAALTSTPVMV
jgi:phosphoglycolate phosphatase